jgi:hypothetical protein
MRINSTFKYVHSEITLRGSKWFAETEREQRLQTREELSIFLFFYTPSSFF